MIILRQKSYSNKDKKKDKAKNTNRVVGAGAAIIGGGVAGDISNLCLNKTYGKSKENQIIHNFGENINLIRKLKEIGEKDGIKINISPYSPDGGSYSRAIDPKTKEILREEIDSSAYAGTLAHELGHSRHYMGRDGNKLGKLAHKTSGKINDTNEILRKKKVPKVESMVASGVGFASGYKAGKDGKDSALNVIAPGAAALISHAPALTKEISATREGYKLLKKSGASKKFLKGYKKTMGHAAGTYASLAIPTLGLAYGSRLVGKVVGSEVRKSKERKENKKKKDK